MIRGLEPAVSMQVDPTGLESDGPVGSYIKAVRDERDDDAVVHATVDQRRVWESDRDMGSATEREEGKKG